MKFLFLLFVSVIQAIRLIVPESRDQAFGIPLNLQVSPIPADSSMMVCRNLPATLAQSVTYPGASLPVKWEFNDIGKKGDCAFYLSFEYANDQNPARDSKWFKIADIPDCHKLAGMDGVYVPIPQWAKAGNAVLRWEFVALGSQQVEFYANCVDLILQRQDGNPGTDQANPSVTIPGHLPKTRSGFRNDGNFFLAGPKIADSA
jgi:hypothetical protein